MSGYIGTQPVPQATQTRDSFTATSGQTSFATGGYTPNFLDVYLNGVKLAAADYTATNGSDVVLASGAATGDILEVVAYTTFTVGSSFTPSIDDNGNATAITIDSSESVLIGKSVDTLATSGTALFANGQIDSSVDGNYVAKFNRKTSDGTIIELRKDTTGIVGSIDTFYGNVMIGKASGAKIAFDNTIIYSTNDAGSTVDNSYDLGSASSRFKDLYLSGGVYLGGTGSANKLDDYESGSFTANGNWATNNNKYIKVGNLVTITMDLVGPASGSHSQFNLPFTCNATSAIGVYTTFVGFSGGRTYPTAVAAGSVCYLRQNGSGVQFAALNVGAGHVLHFSLSYYTTA